MIINKKARFRARQLHKEEHLIIDGEVEKGHNLNDYYYFMACQLVEDLKQEMKELSKQTKYLWQSLEEKKNE